MSLFTDLLQDPYKRKIFLVEVQAYSVADEELQTFYYSDHGYTSGPSDTVVNQHYEGRVISALSFERSMFQSGQVGGRSLPSFGEIVLNNADGGLDFLLDYGIDGRDITVRMGGEGFTYDDYGVIFKGTAQGLTIDESVLRIQIRDLQHKLDIPIQANLYAGTGGNEGGADLNGKPKPLCFGECYNVPAVLVDSSNLVYQVHDGQIEAINAVYDRGVELTITTDYTVDLSTGLITLVAAPAGQITADVEGAKPSGSYKSTAADIIRHIVTAQGGLTDPTDLNTSAFSALNTSNSATVGVFIGTEDRSILEVLDDVVNAVGGFYGFNRAGLFEVGQFVAPSGTENLALTSVEILDDAIAPTPTIAPVWSVSLGYKKNWAVQSADTIASVADTDPSHFDFATNEWRRAVSSDTSVQPAYLLAEKLEKDTLLVDSTAAATEAARIQALLGVKRFVYQIRVKAQPFNINLNDVIKVSIARFGMTSGKKFVVIGITEDSKTNEVTLEVWG